MHRIALLISLLLTANSALAQETAANWIWYPEVASGECVNQSRYLRKAFEVPQKPVSAHIDVVVDDRQTVFVNGQGPLSAMPRDAGPPRYDLTELLHPGKNVIAIEALNVTGPAGIIARLVIKAPDGQETVVGSDATWKASREEQAEWTEAAFGDSEWLQAKVIGPAFTAPWMQFPGYHALEMANEQELADYRAFEASVLAPPEQFAGEPRAQPKLCQYRGVPTLFINGAPYPVVMYRGTVDPTLVFGRQQITNFSDAGIHLECLYTTLQGCWNGPGDYDFSQMDSLIRAFLSADPDAYLLLQIRVIPPEWWMQAHPGEWVAYGTSDALDGKDECYRIRRASPASEVWLKDTVEAWRAIIRHIEDQPWGKRVIGYHAGYGIYSEWHYFGGWSDQYPDTGSAMTRTFRTWLRDKYDSVEALRQAWNDHTVTFDNAEVPGVELRKNAALVTIRDPLVERRVIDYYHCQQKVVADDVEAFGRAAKQETQGNAVYGIYYGYFFGVRPQTQGGHLELERLLKSPYIDYFVAPYSYADRLMGQDGRLRSLASAINATGKVHIIEADIRTYLHASNEYGRTNTLEESLAAIRREFATSLIEHTGFWFVDFGPDSRGGWFDQPDIMAEIGALQRVANESVARPAESVAQIAVIFDLESGYMLGDGEGMSQVYKLVENLTTELYHLGAPFDTLFLSQLETADLSQYKLLIFPNALHMTDAQADVAQELQSNGHHATVFVWAPGLCGPEGLSVERASRVTGLDLSLNRQWLPGRVQVEVDAADLLGGIPSSKRHSIQPTGSVPVADCGDPGRWQNPRSPEQMAKSYALYEVTPIEQGITWTFDTACHWTDIHFAGEVPEGVGVGFDLKFAGDCSRLMLRTVVKDANWAEFVTEPEVILSGEWRRLNYPLAAFTNAVWSKLKPETIARPIRGMKFVLDGANTAGKCALTIRNLSAISGPVTSEDSRAYGKGIFTPALIPSRARGRVLGRLEGTDYPAVVLTGEGPASSLFSAVPFVPRELLAKMVGRSGAHRYIDASGDVLRADSRYICIHTKDGGKRELRLPETETIRDAITGEMLGEGQTIQMNLAPNSTRLLERGE